MKTVNMRNAWMPLKNMMLPIPEFSEKYVNQQTVTFYKLQCIDLYSNQKWGFEKSFDDFSLLQQNLSKEVPNIPEIEGKSFFKVTSFDALTKRKGYLETFLRQCLGRKDIISNEHFKEFLDLEKHSPELLLNTPKKLSEFKDLPLGVKDFIYLENEGIMFIICSDMSLTSRVDAYISNVNLPWENKTESHISVGGFFAYKIKYDSTLGLFFDKIYAKSFPEQTCALNYDRESHTVNIGLDTGRIVFLKIDSESNFQTYENYIDYKPHKSRITGISYDCILFK